MSFFDMPQAFTETTRKAKKPHKCCECGNPINIGDKYQYCSGIWDGSPSSFKTCQSCAEIRSHYMDEHEPIAFGELGYNISECFCEGFGPKEYAESVGFSPDRIMVFFPDYYVDGGAL